MIIIANTNTPHHNNLYGYWETGFLDYNDTATLVTPITVLESAGEVALTNDGLGAYSTRQYAPRGIEDVWNASTGQFDWSMLSLGDVVDIRLDIEVTTTTPNTAIDVKLNLGSNTYNLPFITQFNYKSAAPHSITEYNSFYIGNEGTLNGGGHFSLSSDEDCTVKVRGWYIKITRKRNL